ncbi:hypothetical protein MIND_01373400 [Mycena indigotica]|uniref:Guanine nucleotide-binding protein alpha-4 subunit n=1 Tax=Mycena indigotica TaxID=2126181 RepID=A0A8H6VS40_9AGAR|nr:uncharacterized protein MIND_01373400 [Mycena indigotica]KAF7289981.1 hypothetical protein MIND_01373400 [Mycena indigotica]
MPSKVRRRRSLEDGDPFALILAPPEGETPEQRDVRLLLEKEAKQISDAIDEQLSRERQQDKKGTKPVKVLLLGQSESGKSTTLKNFQLMYDPKAFHAERASWRTVIELNVVRSIHVILEVITRAERLTQDDSSDPLVDQELLALKRRLSPLIHVEEVLMQRLMPSGSDQSDAARLAQIAQIPYTHKPGGVKGEVTINSTTQWKDLFSRDKYNEESAERDATGVLLHTHANDLKTLWGSSKVQSLLIQQNIRLQEAAGFFLDCLDEVTSLDYIPSDDHILRARLKTLGVSEHRIKMTSGGMTGSISRDWRIYDVGGHRSLVMAYPDRIQGDIGRSTAAWAPYFDDMHSIIFLCPISAFDQVLAEEPRVNRLADSVNLWTTIVSNKLLAKTNIILFLNKTDIMKSKLESGIRFVDYVNSYGKRPNDFESASSYLRKKFGGLFKEKSPSPRVFYCHLTTVTDRKSTQLILANIKDQLMQRYLEDASLLA